MQSAASIDAVLFLQQTSRLEFVAAYSCLTSNILGSYPRFHISQNYLNPTTIPFCRDTDLDAVLIHSVIDAVPSPNTLLARMGGARGLVKRNGGIVVVVSPYDWNEEITPREAWLCGCTDYEGKKVRVRDSFAINKSTLHGTYSICGNASNSKSPGRCRTHP